MTLHKWGNLRCCWFLQ